MFLSVQVVHRLYSQGGGAVHLIGEHFPQAIVNQGEPVDPCMSMEHAAPRPRRKSKINLCLFCTAAVDRQQLSKCVVGNKVRRHIHMCDHASAAQHDYCDTITALQWVCSFGACIRKL